MGRYWPLIGKALAGRMSSRIRVGHPVGTHNNHCRAVLSVKVERRYPIAAIAKAIAKPQSAAATTRFMTQV